MCRLRASPGACTVTSGAYGDDVWLKPPTSAAVAEFRCGTASAVKFLKCDDSAASVPARAVCIAHVPIVDPSCSERPVSVVAGHAFVRWLQRMQRGRGWPHDTGWGRRRDLPALALRGGARWAQAVARWQALRLGLVLMPWPTRRRRQDKGLRSCRLADGASMNACSVLLWFWSSDLDTARHTKDAQLCKRSQCDCLVISSQASIRLVFLQFDPASNGYQLVVGRAQYRVATSVYLSVESVLSASASAHTSANVR